MKQRTKTLAYLKMIATALEHFTETFAIYDESDRLVFANTAAFDAMPVFFNSLADGQSLHNATKLHIKQNFPTLSESSLEKATITTVSKQKSGEFYEVPTTGNKVVQVTHQKLNSNFTLGIGMDVTKLKKQKAKLKSLAQENFTLANTDQLTKLANRRYFIDTLKIKISEFQSSNDPFFVGLLDLNGFKRINDLYGHAIGDELLTNVAAIAKNFLHSDAFLARLGGDEFALILENKNITEAELSAYGERLCAAIRQPQVLSGNDLSVSASLGWSSYPKDGKTTSDLLKKSDYALYKSKCSKVQNCVIFSCIDESAILRQSETTLQLTIADLESEIFVEFQPIHNIKSETITGFEALTRWDSPVLGLVSPEEFIQLAEKTGQISELTKIILKKSLKAAAEWPKGISLHFNVSAVDLGRIDVIQDLIAIIEKSGYPPQSIVFEVTETALIDTFENIADVFDLIGETGIRLALDDFGAGYSSLNYLTRIPVTCLKVDKSFTQRLKPNSDEEKILKTVKYLCENLEIDCIIEGVETQFQLDQLTALGMKNMQGFHFSPSIKLQDLAAYLMRYMPKFERSPIQNRSHQFTKKLTSFGR